MLTVSPVRQTTLPGSAATCLMSGTPLGRYCPVARNMASVSGGSATTRSSIASCPASRTAYSPIGTLALAFQIKSGACFQAAVTATVATAAAPITATRLRWFTPRPSVS